MTLIYSASSYAEGIHKDPQFHFLIQNSQRIHTLLPLWLSILVFLKHLGRSIWQFCLQMGVWLVMRNDFDYGCFELVLQLGRVWHSKQAPGQSCQSILVKYICLLVILDQSLSLFLSSNCLNLWPHGNMCNFILCVL